MTWKRILVAVDDSPAGLDGARLAIELTAASKALLRAVTVRRVALDPALDGYLSAQGARHGVAPDLIVLEGEPFRCILEQARAWHADLIVMGRSDRRGPSSPYLGSVTEHVLEFAECAVLVVPQDTRRAHLGRAVPTASALP